MHELVRHNIEHHYRLPAMRTWSAILLAALLLLSGCATNPVTGKNELMLIPESMELQMGQENYMPARQMQGGDYVADPAVTAYVREVGQKMAAVSDRKLPYEFVVVNDSSVNAWMLPGGKMGINRGLLIKMDNEAELAAVIGHEITHAAAKHGAKQMQQGLLLQGAAIAASMAIDASTDNEYAQIAGVIGAQVVTVLLQSKFSRDDENQADHYGMVYMSRAGYDPQAAVSVQELLLKESQGQTDNLFTRLLADHPPSAERVAASKALVTQLPAGGIRANDIYHQRLAHLFKMAPAYAAYDKGQEALQKGDFKTARALAEKAIRIEPREAQFHVLRGSALEKTYRGQMALTEYRKAADMNPGYYAPHLKLGLLLDAMGNRYQAKQALENSINLLKTASAMQRLGRYALADGNTPLARKYLSQAAGSDTPDGKKAYAELLSFDLPVNAAAYLDVAMQVDGNNRLQFIIHNNTPFPVSNIILQVSDNSGSKQLNMNGIIQANAQSVFQMNAQVTQEQINNSSATVVSARLAR